VNIEIRVDLSPLERLHAEVLEGAMSNGPIRRCFRLWAQRYRAAMLERFDSASKGDGTWPPLAESTIRGRFRKPLARLRAALASGDITEEQFSKRYRTARRSVTRRMQKGSKPVGIYGRMQVSASILRDTGTLMNTLSPTLGHPGQLEKDVPFGIIVGISGGSHPSGKLTVGELAAMHHFGGPHLPRREILVEPLEEVKEAMVDDMVVAVQDTIG